MKGTLLLAVRYLTHHRLRSLLLVLAIGLVLLLPFAVALLMRTFGDALVERARATPLLLGLRQSRYDLVLSALYFKGRLPLPLAYGEARAVHDSGLARALPIRAAASAAGLPVVGVSLDYFAFRGLRPERGALPGLLGEAVLGAAAARRTGLGPGAGLLTDAGSLFDLAAGYPLRLRVAGVLAPGGGPDDHAVFVDLKTAWIIEGIGHGHQDAASAGDKVLAAAAGGVALDASVKEYAEITAENVDQFHFHGAEDAFPLTAAILLPADAKSRTILKGRYRVSDTTQVVEPLAVVEELLGFLLKVKRFFDLNFALVALATALLLAVLVLLSLAARRRELRTLARIGCARSTAVRMMAAELVLVIIAGTLLAAGFAWLAARAAPAALLGL